MYNKMNKSIEQQLKILGDRTVDLISREELFKKLEQAEKNQKPLRVKYGADPSAPDVHLGHVVGLNKLREFQQLGHTVIFIIGDFTGMIGDPSGRSEIRKPLSRETIMANARTYQKQIFKVLDPRRTEIRFNSEWLGKMALEEILKLSSRITVAQMLMRDDFQKRYTDNQPISLTEFLYPLIQGYDSIVVEADVEVGGTDQLFNLLIGRDLQKAFGKEPQVIMTLPLLVGLDGVKKMSKSLNNYIGINESAREIFGKVMSINDELMWRYFALILGRSKDEISTLRQAMDQGKQHPRMVKDDLARQIVALFHPGTAAEAASQEFKRIFSEHKLPDTIPTVKIPMSRRNNGKLLIVPLLVTAGLATSKGASRRLIQQGAVKVNSEKVEDINAELVVPENCIIQAGKRAFARIVSG